MSLDSSRTPVSRKSIVSVACFGLLTNVSLLLSIHWLYRSYEGSYPSMTAGEYFWWGVFFPPSFFIGVLLLLLASVFGALCVAVFSMMFALSKDRHRFGPLVAGATITFVLDGFVAYTFLIFGIFMFVVTYLQSAVPSSPVLEVNRSVMYNFGFWYLPLGLFISFCCNLFLAVIWQSIRTEPEQAETLEVLL